MCLQALSMVKGWLRNKNFILSHNGFKGFAMIIFFSAVYKEDLYEEEKLTKPLQREQFFNLK